MNGQFRRNAGNWLLKQPIVIATGIFWLIVSGLCVSFYLMFAFKDDNWNNAVNGLLVAVPTAVVGATMIVRGRAAMAADARPKADALVLAAGKLWFAITVLGSLGLSYVVSAESGVTVGVLAVYSIVGPSILSGVGIYALGRWLRRRSS